MCCHQGGVNRNLNGRPMLNDDTLQVKFAS